MKGKPPEILQVPLIKFCVSKTIICNHGYNILELCNVLVQDWLITSKMNLDVSYNKLGIWATSGDAERRKT